MVIHMRTEQGTYLSVNSNGNAVDRAAETASSRSTFTLFHPITKAELNPSEFREGQDVVVEVRGTGGQILKPDWGSGTLTVSHVDWPQKTTFRMRVHKVNQSPGNDVVHAGDVFALRSPN